LNALMKRLAHGDPPVSLGGPAPAEGLRKCSEDIDFVFSKFIDTQGGTDLGIRVDTTATGLRNTDFNQATGMAHVEGTLTLDYVSARCVTDTDLAILQGTGHVVILQTSQT
jgi:hypothetical protein